MFSQTSKGVLALITLISLTGAFNRPLPAQQKVTYVDHAREALRRCVLCHRSGRMEGGFDASSYQSILAGSSGGDVVVAGDAAASRFYRLITHQEQPYMPPRQDKLDVEQIEMIRAWIDGGLLETADSKAIESDRPSLSMALDDVPLGKPDGPPPMPQGLSVIPSVVTEAPPSAQALACSPWAPLAALAGVGQVLFYHTDSHEFLGMVPFPEGMPRTLRFSRSGVLLLAGGGHAAQFGRVVVWDVKTGERILEVGDEPDAVLAADLSPDQSLVALGGPERLLKLYHTEDGSLFQSIKKHTDWVLAVSFSPDGVLLASGDRNGGLYVWEGQTGQEFYALKGHDAAVAALSWRADSNVLVSADENGRVMAWEMNEGNRVKDIAAHEGGVLDVRFAPDGRLVTSGRDKLVKLWDAEGKHVASFPEAQDIVLQAGFDYAAEKIVTGDWLGRVKVTDLKGKSLGSLSLNPPSPLEVAAQAKQSIVELDALYAMQRQQLQELSERIKAVPPEQSVRKQALQSDFEKLSRQIRQTRKELKTTRQTLNQLDPIVAQLDDPGLKIVITEAAADTADLTAARQSEESVPPDDVDDATGLGKQQPPKLQQHGSGEKWTSATPLLTVFLALQQEPPAHRNEHLNDMEWVRRGWEIVTTGTTTDLQGKQTPVQSEVFRCTDCHNLTIEDPDLSKADPDARLTYALEHDLPFLPGTTLYGTVNKKTWFNGDYQSKKYGDAAKPARNSLREAIQLCSTECSKGRKLTEWELQAVLAYLWNLQYTLGDLGYSEVDSAALQKTAPAQRTKTLEKIKSRFLDHSPATFADPPADYKKGYPHTGNADRGRRLYAASCLYCHGTRPNAPLYDSFGPDADSLSYFKETITQKQASFYHVVRKGIFHDDIYMPNYTAQRMSDQQLEDLRAYFENPPPPKNSSTH